MGRLLRFGFTGCALVIFAAVPALAEDEAHGAGIQENEFEHGENGEAFEQVAPPEIQYEDYAGPDPVLEGSAPPSGEPRTAAERRVQELRGEEPPTGAGTADAPAELGARSLFEAAAALFIVLGLIVLCLFAVRRFGSRTPLLAGANLGQVLGRVHLSPKASLHFVRTGGKVLVVGVTQESVQLVETFDAEAFDAAAPVAAAEEVTEGGESTSKAPAFLAQLREQSSRMRQPAESETPGDGDIANLRGDIERLQRMLRDATRE